MLLLLSEKTEILQYNLYLLYSKFRTHSDTAATQYLGSSKLGLDKQNAANLAIVFANIFWQNSLFVYTAALCVSKPSCVEHRFGVAAVSACNQNFSSIDPKLNK